MSTKSQWRPGAGGAPILSQPIASYRQYPLGLSGDSRWYHAFPAGGVPARCSADHVCDEGDGESEMTRGFNATQRELENLELRKENQRLREQLVKALKALKPFAYYYELNDCDERDPDDALEVPIRDLAKAWGEVHRDKALMALIDDQRSEK